MYKVRKREGKIVSFDIKKITDAITKAFEAESKSYDENVIDFLALKVTADFAIKVKDDIVNVEDIQDSVEKVLINAGYDVINYEVYDNQGLLIGLSVQKYKLYSIFLEKNCLKL